MANECTLTLFPSLLFYLSPRSLSLPLLSPPFASRICCIKVDAAGNPAVCEKVGMSGGIPQFWCIKPGVAPSAAEKQVGWSEAACRYATLCRSIVAWIVFLFLNPPHRHLSPSKYKLTCFGPYTRCAGFTHQFRASKVAACRCRRHQEREKQVGSTSPVLLRKDSLPDMVSITLPSLYKSPLTARI